jgi:hypothetical protein
VLRINWKLLFTKVPEATEPEDATKAEIDCVGVPVFVTPVANVVDQLGSDELPVGIETIATVAVTVSPVPVDRYVCVTVSFASAPGSAVAVVADEVNVSACGTAVAGATDVRTPKPNAATATSAMRLKVVFVDICFLSISRFSDDPSAGFV